jgi:hypothetical protein
MFKFLRERNRPSLNWFVRSNINQPGPEALSKRGHLPRPDLWTQTPHGRCSTVGWIVLLDRSTAAIGATNMRTNQPRRIEN